MKNNSKVSIIIPVYNGAKYVEYAIESALAQTYENIEIIVVNDGSQDNTEEILKKYDGKIKYFKKENGGVSTALNLAIENMTGDYFSWLSHDDLYYPNKIEEELKYVEDKTIVMSDYNLIDEDGKLITEVSLEHNLIEKHYEFALFKGYINGITLLIPKKAFDECGNFDEKLRCTQDYDMWLRMLLKGYKFKHIPKILAATRTHKNQVTNTSPKMITEGNALWIDMMEKLPKKIKEQINNTEYNFYRDVSLIMKYSPYQEAYNYCLNKMKEISKEDIDLEKYKVSVIMPFYDETKEVLLRAINSVKNQVHKNIELILINDNPSFYNKTDIKEITKGKNIKLLENEKNLGVSASRNKGIEVATGDYIAFLDADDEFLPNKIDVQLKELILTKENFSHTSYVKISSNKETISSGNFNGMFKKTNIYSCEIATPTVMLKREFLIKNKLKFNEQIHIGEDTCLWLEILLLTPIVGIEKPLTNVHTNETSSAYDNKKQIIGLKNILTFVLNNRELNRYDNEIAKLASYYVNLIMQTSNNEISYEYNKVINSLSWKITKPLRLIHKTFISLKEDGITKTFKKIGRFICKKR